MDEPRGCPWDEAMVTDAMDGVMRTLHLRDEQAHTWRCEAWAMLLVRGTALQRSFRRESSLRTFIGAVLYKHAVSWQRRVSAARDAFDASIRPLDEASQALRRLNLRGVADSLVAADEARTRKRNLDRLHGAIDRLSADDRFLIVEHYLQNRTLAALAVELGCTHVAARQRAHRAFERLRAGLGSQT